MQTTASTCGDRIKVSRQQLGLTQAELAKSCGLAQSAIGNLESGIRKSPKHILIIAKALNVDAMWLQYGHAQSSMQAAAMQTTPTTANSHAVDCHILTLSRFNSAWVSALRGDLEDQPVNQHWLPGIEGDLAQARANGFSFGSAPLVASVDPDDRILPGTFAALEKALNDNPAAPFAWAGEQMTNEELANWPIRSNVWPNGYDPALHICRATHVHGVKLYRRAKVMPLLESMRSVGQACEFYLDLAIAKPYENPPRTEWPVHVPMVGRLWRQHDNNGSRSFSQDDFKKAAQALGFDSISHMQKVALNKFQTTGIA